MVQLFCTVFNNYQSKTAIDRNSEDRKLDTSVEQKWKEIIPVFVFYLMFFSIFMLGFWAVEELIYDILLANKTKMQKKMYLLFV